ncbi:MAG TPA: S1 RNA-binding domain-containing protein [Ktedonobacterales bacterium]|nr:S1 RNA-binding domain-containing protein [Ktedonobacterales bacterium]
MSLNNDDMSQRDETQPETQHEAETEAQIKTQIAAQPNVETVAEADAQVQAEQQPIGEQVNISQVADPQPAAEPAAEQPVTEPEPATTLTAASSDDPAAVAPAADEADEVDEFGANAVSSDNDDMYATDNIPDMSAMQRLLDEQDAQFRTIKRGDVVEGQIVRIDPDEILVDIGLKSEGVLSTKELPSSGYGSLPELDVGTNVLVYIMQPETPEGHAVVSIKRARQERQWRIAQEQFDRGELLEAEVIDHNKGGLIVNLDGIRGFVPISQILNLRREDSSDNAETQTKLQAMVGRKLQLKIIEINRNRNRLILSERIAVQEWRARRREELLNELQVGEVRTGVVSNLANFGAFVDLGGADGLVHISQLAWSRVNHPSEVLKVGQKVEVQVLSVDKEKKKIALSIKRAEVDPWTTVEQRYHVGQLVTGTITKIAPFGAFARIEDGVEGLIHLSELPAGQQDPKAVLHEGEEVTVRILRIDPERRRLGLSIKAVDEGGAAGEGEPAPVASAQGESAAATTGEEAAPAISAEPARPAPRQPAPQPQPEAPTTAMAEAFRQARQAQSRDQADQAEQVEQPEQAEQPATASDAAPAAPAPVAAEAASASNGAAEPAALTAPPAATNGASNGATEPAATAESAAETTEATAEAETPEAAEATTVSDEHKA